MESLSDIELEREFHKALKISGIGHLNGYTLEEQKEAQKRAKQLQTEIQRRELARLEEQLKRQEATEQTAETDTKTSNTNKTLTANNEATSHSELRGEGGEMYSAEGDTLGLLEKNGHNKQINNRDAGCLRHPKASKQTASNHLTTLGLDGKARRRGSRATGTNPRALGTNPRALGTNPRAIRAEKTEGKATNREEAKQPSISANREDLNSAVDRVKNNGVDMFSWKLDEAPQVMGRKISALAYRAFNAGISERWLIYQIAECYEYGRNPMALFTTRVNRAIDQRANGLDADSLRNAYR